MTQKNRLHLDFSIETSEGRKDFVESYLKNDQFQIYPPTAEESETIANYILWGKQSNGRNLVQDKKIQIDTKYKTWNEFAPESLDALMEQPTFNEASLSPLLPHAQIRIPREVFSRKKALENAPAEFIPKFLDLFQQIDELDLVLNYYDLEHGKRKLPPREALVKKFTEEEQQLLYEKSTHLSSYTYLKKRHELVELRRQQYTLKDMYNAPFSSNLPPVVDYTERGQVIDADIPVFPLGLDCGSTISRLLFREIEPTLYSEEELGIISKFYWEHRDLRSAAQIIDFENEEHVYQIFGMFYELGDAGKEGDVENTTTFLLKTLEWYTARSGLNDLQQEILRMKIGKKRNQDIAAIVNEKYGKSYSANYISTIFRHKIIPQICEAAELHRLEIENIYFLENYKKCSHCGRLLLIHPYNFVRKTRSKDGFANRCKKCDRAERKRRNENGTN